MSLNAMAPDCPSCGAWITKVVMTKLENECEAVIRRRHCEYCDHRFYTRQLLEEIVDVKWVPGLKKGTIPKVIKVYATSSKKRKSA